VVCARSRIDVQVATAAGAPRGAADQQRGATIVAGVATLSLAGM
jgi:hypothetical protein